MKFFIVVANGYVLVTLIDRCNYRPKTMTCTLSINPYGLALFKTGLVLIKRLIQSAPLNGIMDNIISLNRFIYIYIYILDGMESFRIPALRH